MIRNNQHTYGWVSIIIHWLMAVLMLGMFALGLYMVELNYLDAWYKTAPWLHQSVGMVLFLLLIFRLIWRLINPLPMIYGNSIEKVIALWVHRTHYLLMFALMFSGYVMVTADGRGIVIFDVFEVAGLFAAAQGRADVAGLIHMIIAWFFIAFVSLHAMAALKHHMIDKDRTLLRMLGINKEKNNE